MPEPDPVTVRRVLLHLDDGHRVPLDPAEIFLLEAEGDETARAAGGLWWSTVEKPGPALGIRVDDDGPGLPSSAKRAGE